jgi:hypothetical protein
MSAFGAKQTVLTRRLICGQIGAYLTKSISLGRYYGVMTPQAMRSPALPAGSLM